MSVERALLVCGAAEDEELWDAVMPALDMPSEIQVLEPTDDLAALTAAVAARLSPTTALVGHSLGGAIAARIAVADPAASAGFVLVACGSTLPVHAATWALLHKRGPAGLARSFAEAACGGHADVADRMEAMVLRHAGALEPHLRACDAFALAASTPTPAPIEVVAGARDRLVSRRLMTALADVLGARLTVLPDAGHQVPWEAPEAVAAAVGRLDRVA